MEIEVKVLEINQKEIERKLKNLGAKKIFKGNMEFVCHDYKDKRLIKSGKILRVRKEGNKTILTLKEKVSQKGAKIMEEYETSIGDYKVANLIFKKLGYVPLTKQKKHRISFSLGKIHFDIDTIPKIPTFMEIEAPSKKSINNILEKLEIDRKKVKSWNGKELLEHYGLK